MKTSEKEQHRREFPVPEVVGRAAVELAPAMTECLLTGDAPDATAREVSAAAGAVRRGVAAMPDLLRAGAGLAARAVGAGLSVSARRRFTALPAAARAPHARRLARANIPVAAEFVRLSRGLGLAELYESRTPDMLRSAGIPPAGERSGQ